MATAALVSVEDFVRDYIDKGDTKPSMEYIDGVLRQKTMGNIYHGYVQGRVCGLIGENYPELIPATELHVRIRETEFLVPDVAAIRRSEVEGLYPTTGEEAWPSCRSDNPGPDVCQSPTKPVYLCVEILSKDDRFSEVLAKCEEYHKWGVEVCWIIDPISRRAWTYSPGQPPREVGLGQILEAKDIRIALADVFAGLP